MSSKRRDVWLVLGLALILRVLTALPQMQPNYMDAAYYTVGGQRLAQGYGFNDPYVWNYLDQPTGLPHPSHLYWMPLPSILVAISQAIFGVTYHAAQLPFVLLAAVLPVIAYAIARRVSSSRRNAWLAALLTIFSAYYFPYWGVPESFAPFAVFGALALYWGSGPGNKEESRQGDKGESRQGNKETSEKVRLLLAGACAGLAHLSRADGMLLLIAILVNAEFGMRDAESLFRIPTGALRSPHSALRLRPWLFIVLGYGVVMLPWFIRNLTAIGAPLSSAGAQTLWLCSYDELFAYGARFDLNHLLGCGIDRVVLAKINGVAAGALHWLAEVGMIFLAPLIVVGLWKERREPLFRAALLYALLLFAAMTLAFTFAGDRGGLFHSSGALLPFFYAAAPIGLDAIVGWIAQRRRTWKAATARSVFGVAVVVLAIGLSVLIYRGRVIGRDAAHPIWNQADDVYETIGRWLAERGEADPIVMVNNPPSFTYHTGLPSIVAPYGAVNDLLQAAQQFGARWLILDANRPEPLAALYLAPNAEPRLKVRATFGPAYLLQVCAQSCEK